MKDVDTLSAELQAAVAQIESPVARLRAIAALMERPDNQGPEARAFYWAAVLGFAVPNVEANGNDPVTVFNLALAAHRGRQKAKGVGLS